MSDNREGFKFSGSLRAVARPERSCWVAVELLPLDGPAEVFAPRSFTCVGGSLVLEAVKER